MSSSWLVGVPRDFSLEASKAFIESTRNGVFWDACWSWLGARPRTALWQTGGNGTHAVRSAVGRAVGRTAHTGGAGLCNRRQAHGVLVVQRQYSFRRQPEVTQRGKGVTTQTCFLPRGRRAQARSVGEGTSPCKANLGFFSWAFTQARGVRAKGAGPSGRNKPAGFPLTFCFVCRDFHRSLRYDVGWKGFKEEN